MTMMTENICTVHIGNKEMTLTGRVRSNKMTLVSFWARKRQNLIRNIEIITFRIATSK